MKNSLRAWIFRFLVVIAMGLFIASWFIPWWECAIPYIAGWIHIRPWGLEFNLGFYESYASQAVMPAFMAPAMWTYFGLAILGYIASMFVKEKEIKIFKLKFKLNQFLVLLIGLSWIIAGLAATLLAAVQTGNYFNTPLIGHNVVDLGGHYEADTYSNFLPGYYLIYASGLVALITAHFYNKLLGHKTEK